MALFNRNFENWNQLFSFKWKTFTLYNNAPFEDGILQSIKYAPGIEEIDLVTYSEYITHGYNAEYLGQLRELKSLEIHAKDKQYVVSAIHEIAKAKIALEYLRLGQFDLRPVVPQFIEQISRLENLKTLRCSFIKNMRASHVIEICKKLKELSEIDILAIDLKMNADSLLELIRHAKKLKKFEYDISLEDFLRHRDRKPEKLDVECIEKLAKIVGQRNQRNNVVLLLNRLYFTLPAESTRAASNFKPSVKSNSILDELVIRNK